MQERCQAAKESHGAQRCALPKYQRYGAVAAARVLGSGVGWQVAGGGQIRALRYVLLYTSRACRDAVTQKLVSRFGASFSFDVVLCQSCSPSMLFAASPACH